VYSILSYLYICSKVKYGVKDDLLKGFNNLVNTGRHKIFTGGRYDSYLLVPLIPEPRNMDLSVVGR
jgi:hypothetical protein